jgi:three-Cys-motif partner protein
VLDVDLLQHFHLFEINGPKLELLRKLKDDHPGRDVNIYPIDFNEGVLALLRPELIPERQATFCLIDQHTFECAWETLKAIAAYKAGGYKIELFYFLATGWLDRAMSATKDDERLRRWWGGEGYAEFLRLGATERAYHFAKRLRDELGYAYVFPWAIHEKEHGGRIMYFMVHAADHPDAPKLMWRAYSDVQPHAPVPEKLSLF